MVLRRVWHWPPPTASSLHNPPPGSSALCVPPNGGVGVGWLGAAAPAGTGGGAVDTGSSEVKLQKFYMLTKTLLQAGLPGGPLPPLEKSLSPDSADYLVPGYGLWRCGWARALRMATASPFQGHTCAGPPRRQVAATQAALAPEVVVRTTAQVRPALWARNPVWKRTRW